MKFVTAASTQSWEYLNSQLDRGKQYRAHILYYGRTVCGLTGMFNNTTTLEWQQYQDYEWSCKKCRELYARMLEDETVTK